MARKNTAEVVRAKLASGTKRSGECLLWAGPLNKGGYAPIQFMGRKVLLHRLVAFLDGKLESLDSPLRVLHKCDTPSCCETTHLFVGSQTDNMQDMIRKGRKKWPSGAAHGMARLSFDKAQAIRDAHRSGERQVDIAKRYGIHQTHVSRIIRNELWTVD